MLDAISEPLFDAISIVLALELCMLGLMVAPLPSPPSSSDATEQAAGLSHSALRIPHVTQLSTPVVHRTSSRTHVHAQEGGHHPSS